MCARVSAMATTTLTYKGLKMKDGFLRLLRERGHLDPSRLWRNKDLVQALIKSDLDRNGDGVDDAGTPGNSLRGEDPDDADSIAEHRNDEGDDEEAADNKTALWFMVLLEVDVNTPEGCLGALVDSKFPEGPKGVSTLAAAAAASSILTTDSIISNLERRFRLFSIWNGSLDYFQFGTAVSDFKQFWNGGLDFFPEPPPPEGGAGFSN